MTYRSAMMSRDYLHERAEESRHEETIAYIMFLAGAILFIGGVLETLSLGENVSWFLILPFIAEASSGAFLGATMIILGLALAIFGVACGLHRSRDRSWYLQELRKSGAPAEDPFKPRKTVQKELT
ncbi:hypothetical protein KEJ15_04945, partial [Candidatus Bathyarchaeota archaeon]|nr:hypothetical protein [Candidatus Bathyarchaeota archaeon]